MPWRVPLYLRRVQINKLKRLKLKMDRPNLIVTKVIPRLEIKYY